MNSKATEIIQKYNVSTEDFWQTKDGHIGIRRSGIEKIEREANIIIGFEVSFASRDAVILRGWGNMDGGQRIFTSASAIYGGSPAPKSFKYDGGTTSSWYIAEVAESRLRSRLVLKLTGLYSHNVHGEDENEDAFSNPPEKNKAKADIMAESLVKGKYKRK